MKRIGKDNGSVPTDIPTTVEDRFDNCRAPLKMELQRLLDKLTK